MTKLLNRLRKRFGYLPIGYHIEMHPMHSKLCLCKDGEMTDHFAYYRHHLFFPAWEHYENKTTL